MESMDETALRAHYERMDRADAYVSKCKMWLPDDLAGKTVLDVGCRRGKGVYEISEHAGQDGFVVGVDWNEGFLERAREGERHALDRSGFADSNMAFALGMPETADMAAAAWAPFDVAIANSVMNLAYDRPAAYAAIARALRPGGLFYHAAVVADADPGVEEVRAACKAGDARAAATSEATLLAELRDAGFATCQTVWRDADFEDAPGTRAVVVAARTAQR